MDNNKFERLVKAVVVEHHNRKYIEAVRVQAEMAEEIESFVQIIRGFSAEGREGE